MGKNYCVIYTQVLKQWNVTETIKRALPEDAGEVFYPCVEFWWHGLNRPKYKALFPGYVFIRSEMESKRLHELIRRNRREILSFVKELHLSEKRAVGEEVFDEESAIIDLSDDEAEFFDMLLGFEFDGDLDRRREEAEKEGKIYLPPGTVETEEPIDTEGMTAVEKEKAAMEAEYRRRKKKLPEKGVLQISFGYMENDRFIVMDGPLRGHEEYIKDYKRKDQKAYLSVSVAGHVTKAGLVLLGKKIWFPNDENALGLLSDGTEVDVKRLVRDMSNNAIHTKRRR